MSKSQSFKSGGKSMLTSLTKAWRSTLRQIRRIRMAREEMYDRLESPPGTTASNGQSSVDAASHSSLRHEETNTTSFLPSTTLALTTAALPLSDLEDDYKTHILRALVLSRDLLQVSHVGTSQAGRTRQTRFETYQDQTVNDLALDDRTTGPELISLLEAYHELSSVLSVEDPEVRWKLTKFAEDQLNEVIWRTKQRIGPNWRDKGKWKAETHDAESTDRP